MRLRDKVAIVTGAAQGIGAAYARGLAREGAAVAVVDILDPNPVAEDLVGTVVYLSSSDSDMMTGQVLLVDGGTAFH